MLAAHLAGNPLQGPRHFPPAHRSIVGQLPRKTCFCKREPTLARMRASSAPRSYARHTPPLPVLGAGLHGPQPPGPSWPAARHTWKCLVLCRRQARTPCKLAHRQPWRWRSPQPHGHALRQHRVQIKVRNQQQLQVTTTTRRPRTARHHDPRSSRPSDALHPDVANLGRFCDNGELTEVVAALDLLLQKGTHVDSVLFYSVLRRCIAQKDIAIGRRIHALCVRGGYSSNAFVANHIIRMYVSNGKLVEATEVFTKVPVPNIHMWAAIILAHVEHALPKLAIKLYRAMCKSAVRPNSYIFVAVLKACARAEDLASGREVHADILRRGCQDELFVANSLVDMYAKCGMLVDAAKVFDSMHTKDVVTWNAMIAGYVQHGLAQEALALYARMQPEFCISADHFTFSCVLKACGIARALVEGKKIHSQIRRKGLETHVVVGNCLVDMYAKCGALEDARRLFNHLRTKDVVTWTIMITEYVAQEKVREALILYADMRKEGMILANKVTFVCLLKACTSAGALHLGERLHAQILERGLETDLVVGNCLVHMYAQCGRLSDACAVFERMPKKDVVTWNSLLKGYAEHSDAGRAIQCFQEMRRLAVEPNEVTFCCLLVACSHEGLVTEGRLYFKRMMENHGIAPNAHHVACMVDLLGRSRRLEEAEHMLRTMPFETDLVGWITLLNACKIHGDIDRGRRCFERLISMDAEDARAYVLLASMYASVGRWDDVDRVEGLRKSAGAKKKPARACIEVNKELHEFTVGEEKGFVPSKLRDVSKRLKYDGSHVPHTQLVLKPVSDGEKEDALCGHAEKLALAYGLLNTPDGTTLLVTKNLRMCNDCHSGTKVMSRLEKRDIVVRDAHRIHRFVDGSCSCGDRH